MPVRRVISTQGASFSSTSTQYASPINPTVWANSIAAARAKWTAPVYFRGLRIVLDTAPGSGNAWTFTINIDGVDTDATITISGSSTEATLEDRIVVFAALNALVVLKRTATGTPSAADITDYGLIVDGVESRISTYGGAPGPVGQTTHLLNPAIWNGSVLGYLNDILPCPFTMQRWVVTLNAAPGVGSSVTLTVRAANGAIHGDPMVTQGSCVITISGTETEGEVSPDITWPAGTRLQVIYSQTGSPATSHAAWSVRGHIAGADGQSIMGTSGDPVIKHDGTGWYSPNGSEVVGSEASAATEVVAGFEIVAKAVRQFDGTPEGTELFFTTRKNFADTAVVVNLAGPNVEGEFGVEQASALVAAGDSLDEQVSNGGASVSAGHVGQWAYHVQALAESPIGEIGPLLHVDWPRLVQL